MGLITGNTLPVTSFYAGVLSLAFAATAVAVSLAREGTIQEIGIWGLFQLALLEYNQALGSTTLWWWGLLFTVLRITHAIQLSKPGVIPIVVRIFSFLGTIILMIFAGFKLAASGCSG